MSNNDGFALLGLFLFGVFIGALMANSGKQIDFTIVTSKQGIGYRVSSRDALPL